MSVGKILQKKGAAQLRAGLIKLCKERGVTRSDLQRKIYGSTASGSPSGNHEFYSVQSGTKAFTKELAQKWAAALDIPAEQLLALRDARSAPESTDLVPLKPPAVRGRPPGVKNLPVNVTLPLPFPADPPELPQFSLVVNNRGRATLAMNLTDIPMDTAMRALQALTAIGILSTEDHKQPPAARGVHEAQPSLDHI